MPASPRSPSNLEAGVAVPAGHGPSQPGGPETSICDLLDRVLDRGVVLEGDIVISVAGVDLLYLRLEALLASVAKAIEAGAYPHASARPEAPPR